MAHALNFESAFDSGSTHQPSTSRGRSRNPLLTRTSHGLTTFRQSLVRLIGSAGEDKQRLRDEVLKRLMSAPEPRVFISELLNVCTAASGRDGLEVAIDVLSQTGNLLLDQYAWDYLVADMWRSNHPSLDIKYLPNDDYWYVLLRSIARCDAAEDVRYRFIAAFGSAPSRGLMEGVVEALGDLESAAARKLLGEISGEHADPFICELAREVLDDRVLDDGET
ncbi:MAG: hypothetical protein WDZ51_01820 [Pirellulaceae bacterium]